MQVGHAQIHPPLPRFFTTFRENVFDEIAAQQSAKTSNNRDAQPLGEKIMRYVGYVRISSDEQVGNFSIDAQKREITAWVQARGGHLTTIYMDEAQSGRTSKRPEFQQMRADAKKGLFDAIVVHKFDRFSRNRTDSIAIKALLRCDYGIKVFSVSEPSEDSDGPLGALIEGIMESVADWYSRNLATETAKGKKERSRQGLHNNVAPFGYTKDQDKVLIRDKHEAEGLQMAFEAYATGKYSDNAIAQLLNDNGYQSKTGRPFSKETVRSLLQNRTYLGEVRYMKYRKDSTGKRKYDAPTEWFDGQHDPILSEELFERCQKVREGRRTSRRGSPKGYTPYPLRNLVYCYQCSCHHPKENAFRTYGKMRGQMTRGYRYYRCRANELGFQCDQKGVKAEDLEGEIATILKYLQPRPNWQNGLTKAFGDLLDEPEIESKIEQIQEQIRRMDVRWDNGFITDEHEFVTSRLNLQHELEQYQPVPMDELENAAHILTNFSDTWQERSGDDEAKNKLIGAIVERVYVEDKAVAALTLKPNYHLVLGHNTKEPTSVEIDPYFFPRRERRDSNPRSLA